MTVLFLLNLVGLLSPENKQFVLVHTPCMEAVDQSRGVVYSTPLLDFRVEGP